MDPLSWIIVLLLVLVGGFFSAAETAFNCINVYKLRVKADDGSKIAKLVVKISEKFDRTLISLLFSYNLSQIGLTTLSTVLFYDIFNSIIPDEAIITLINTIVMTIITYILSDTVPKMIASKAPEVVASFTAYPVYVFNFIFFPISWLFEQVVKLIKKIIKVGDSPTLTEEDFNNVLEMVEQSGGLNEDETDIIQATFDFSETLVKDIYTHIDNVTTLQIKDLKKDVLNQFLVDVNYSRIPVTSSTNDKVIGVLHVKSYLNGYLKDKNISVRKLLHRPYYVTLGLTISEVLEGFKKNRTHIGIVLDERGIFSGIVTMDDLLEELIGTVEKAHDDNIVKVNAKGVV